MDRHFDPERDFPGAIRHLSDQFGISATPGGLSLPTDRHFPAMSSIYVHGLQEGAEHPDYWFTSTTPQESGDLYELNLEHEHGGDYLGPENAAAWSFRNMVDEDTAMTWEEDLGTTPDALGLTGIDDFWAHGGGWDDVNHLVNNYPNHLVPEGTKVPHPLIRDYNVGITSSLARETRGGKYIIGQGRAHGGHTNTRYLLDPSTGSVEDTVQINRDDKS